MKDNPTISNPQPPANQSYFFPLTALVPPIGLVVAFWLWFKQGKRVLGLLTVSLSILGLLTYVFLYNHYFGNRPTYSYKTLQSAKVLSGQQGPSISFQKPAEFESLSSTSPAHQTYRQNVKVGGNTVTLGSIRVSVLSSSSTEINQHLPVVAQALNSSLANPKYREATKQFFATYVKNAFSTKSSYQVNLSPPYALKTPNIRSNAWYYDFTASDPTDHNNPEMAGKVIYAFGKEATYYFLIAATKDNWQTNQKIWQQVIDSLKIDQ